MDAFLGTSLSRSAESVTSVVFLVLQMYAMACCVDVPSKVGDLETLILITSCICHDLDHPGYNNIYQVSGGGATPRPPAPLCRARGIGGGSSRRPARGLLPEAFWAARKVTRDWQSTNYETRAGGLGTGPSGRSMSRSR